MTLVLLYEVITFILTKFQFRCESNAPPGRLKLRKFKKYLATRILRAEMKYLTRAMK